MPIVYKNASPYFKTPQRNFFVEFLDVWNKHQIPADSSDEILIVQSKFHQRPDLLSNNLYGTPDLWWIFAVRNPDQIIDPIFDLVEDLEILVPTKERLFSLLGL